MGAYSRLISSKVRSSVTFELVQKRLLAFVSAQVQRGDYTERGLARVIGVSQPQIHNLLKGKRRLQPSLADRIMAKFDIDILDLLEDPEVRLRLVGGSSLHRTLPINMAEEHRPPRKGPGRVALLSGDLAG
jgi:hypothetical protein